MWRIFRDAGREPTPARSGPSWSEFIRSQAKAVIATDFFTVDTVLLRRFYVMFWIELDTRVVHLSGITTSPSAPRTTKQGRNLLMHLQRTVRFVIHDGGGQHTRSFDDVFTAVGAASRVNRELHARFYESRGCNSPRPLTRTPCPRTPHQPKTPRPAEVSGRHVPISDSARVRVSLVRRRRAGRTGLLMPSCQRQIVACQRPRSPHW